MEKAGKHIARWISILSWLVLVSLLLLVTFRFLLSTVVAHNMVAEQLTKTLENTFNSQLEIGNISGDAWKNLVFEDISMQGDGIQISVNRIEIRYVFIELLLEDVQIQDVIIEGIESEFDLNLIKYSASENNLVDEEVKPTELAINQIQVYEANFKMKSTEYFPDSSVSITDLTYRGDLLMGRNRRVGFQDLNFKIENGRLPNSISFGFDGVISDKAISLNDLVFGMGSSVIKGAVNADLNSEKVYGRVESNKINYTDFLSAIPSNFEIEEHAVAVVIEGEINDFGVTVSANGNNLNDFTLKAGFRWEEQPILYSLNMFGEKVSLSNERDSLLISGGPVEIDINGNITGFDTKTNLDWSAGILNLEFNEYHFESIQSRGELQQGSVSSSVDLLSDTGESLQTEISIDSLFSKHPNWEIDYFIQNLNPSMFYHKIVDGEIHASGRLSGNSFSIPDSSIQITIQNRDPKTSKTLSWKIGEDIIDELNVSATISSSRLTSDAYLRVLESEVDVEIQVIDPFSNQTEYTYQANFENMNIGNISTFKGNSTQLTGLLYGIGNGRTLDDASMFGTLSIQNGQINNANIESFDATVQYDEGTLIIQEGILESEIAGGELNGQRDIRNVANPENYLNLDLTLKNLQPLAGLFGLSALEANGQLSGVIQQDMTGVLIGDFDLDLTNVLVDSVFSATAILGTSNVQIESKRNFNANLVIQNPIINDLIFQDISMETNGYFDDDSLSAGFNLTVIGSDRGRLFQQGTIEKDLIKELIDIKFYQFDFLSEESDLLLQKPFNVRVFNNEFGTDTLNLASDNGAYLEFAIPFSSEDEVLAFIRGNSFDLGLIQEIVFGERFVDGILSGEFNYHQALTEVKGNGFTKVDQLSYKGINADSLIFSFDISDEQLDAKGNLFWGDSPEVAAWAIVPFVVDKIALDDDFFSRPIRGALDIQETDLSKFSELLTELGVENTTGIATISAEMSGEVGTPKVAGLIEIDDPVLSGISVDLLSTEFNYSNSSKQLLLQSEIFAQNTLVAELDIAYPLDYDFRTYELYLPNEEDQVEIRAFTNNLNIALFNDFLDPNYMASMNGELNADLELIGPLGDIRPTGFFKLQRGSVTVPYSGIKLKNINIELEIDETELIVQRMYAESGRGRISAKGRSNLEGIFPQDVNVDITATSFEVEKTQDINLVVDLNATLTGKATSPELNGEAVVKRGFYMLTNFGEEAIEDIILEDENIASFSPFDSLIIDLKVDFRRDFFVRSRDFLDVEMEPIGSLDIIKKKNSEPQLFGVLTVDDGYIRPLGKRFNVSTGTFTFIGNMENPELDFHSSYVPQVRQKGESVTLFYNIGGTRFEPTFMFEGDPVMEESDVICYTLFNKPCYSLDSWQSVFAEGNDAQAFQVLTDVLLDEVEALATRQLGVDVVQIDNSGQNGRTAITTGWYLNERTFFSIINELTSSTPKTLFVLEYLLNENWDLIITQGDDARQGVDVRYQFDY